MTTQRKAAPAPQDGLLDLLSGPATPDPPVAPPDPLWGALGVTWPKPPAGRHLCQDCVSLINGKTDGPHPRRATHRRKGPVSDLLLCSAHAFIRAEEDERVKRQYADRIDAVKAAQKAVVTRKGYSKPREHN